MVQCNGVKSEQFPEDSQVRPKHIAIDVILMLFWIKKKLWTFLSWIKDGGESVSDTSMQQGAQI
jgi:hypothetical protein